MTKVEQKGGWIRLRVIQGLLKCTHYIIMWEIVSSVGLGHHT